MATITTTDWDATGVYKDGSYSSLTTSKQKQKVFNVTIGMCENYATGGIVVDLSDGGRITTVVAVQPMQTSNPALLISYAAAAADAAATGKVQFFESVAGACAVALTELTCASCAINDVTFKLFTIGK